MLRVHFSGLDSIESTQTRLELEKFRVESRLDPPLETNSGFEEPFEEPFEGKISSQGTENWGGYADASSKNRFSSCVFLKMREFKKKQKTPCRQ